MDTRWRMGLVILLVACAWWSFRSVRGTTGHAAPIATAPKKVSLAAKRAPAAATIATAALNTRPIEVAAATLPNAASKSPDERAEECFRKFEEQHADEKRDFNARIFAQLSGVVGNWYYDQIGELNSVATPADLMDRPIPPETTPSGKFLLALSKGRFLEGAAQGIRPADTEGALHLLEQAAATDPRNSAPLVYALALAEKIGDQEKIEELKMRIRFTDHFNAYFDDIVGPILAAVKKPQDLMYSQDAIYSMPLIEPKILGEILSENKLEQVAAQIADHSMERSDGIPGVDFSFRQYLAAYTTLKKLRRAGNLPSPEQLFTRLRSQGDIPVHSFWDVLAQRCDPADLDPMIRRLQDHLTANKSR